MVSVGEEALGWVSCEVTVRMLTRAELLKACWTEECLASGSLTWLPSPCRLLVEGLSYSQCGALHKLLDCPHWQQLTSSRVSAVSEEVETAVSFLTEPGKLGSRPLHHNFLVTQFSLVWEEGDKGINSKKQGGLVSSWSLVCTFSVYFSDHFFILVWSSIRTLFYYNYFCLMNFGNFLNIIENNFLINM